MEVTSGGGGAGGATGSGIDRTVSKLVRLVTEEFGTVFIVGRVRGRFVMDGVGGPQELVKLLLAATYSIQSMVPGDVQDWFAETLMKGMAAAVVGMSPAEADALRAEAEAAEAKIMLEVVEGGAVEVGQ